MLAPSRNRSSFALACSWSLHAVLHLLDLCKAAVGTHTLRTPQRETSPSSAVRGLPLHKAGAACVCCAPSGVYKVGSVLQSVSHTACIDRCECSQWRHWLLQMQKYQHQHDMAFPGCRLVATAGSWFLWVSSPPCESETWHTAASSCVSHWVQVLQPSKADMCGHAGCVELLAMQDFSFYGNKTFQSAFIQILSPGASLLVSLLWTLLNSGCALIG